MRLAYHLALATRQPPLAIDDVHESFHYCSPLDVDFQFEMNNGRVLTIYDLGRIPMALRLGLLKVMRQKGWGFAMAGASVRYRRRVTAFERIRMTSRAVGRDARFIYIEQTMWKRDGEAASNILYRSAITSKKGIVPTEDVGQALGIPEWDPPLPDWAANWIEAEDSRLWPPLDT